MLRDYPEEWVGVHNEEIVAHHADLKEFVELLKAGDLLELSIAADRMIPRTAADDTEVNG